MIYRFLEPVLLRRRSARARLPLLILLLLAVPALLRAQTSDAERPVPILTGSAGYFTNVYGGQTELVPQISPVVLVPLGERWLVEARGEFKGEFERSEDGGPYGGKVEKELDYLQVDYIANPYITVTAGRFLTPFGIFNERLYPIWIRSLQDTPLIFPVGTGSSDGAMLRGAFPVSSRVNLNYAGYFSAASTVNKFESERLAGGRVGFFMPGPRIEVGASWQKLLQEERGQSAGFHFAWQPAALPLNLRSEYAWSKAASGYWIEAAYRLSQVPVWQKVMRHTEIVGRAQQLFAGEIEEEEAEEYGLPDVGTQQMDFGVNYYLKDGLKAAASYARRFSPDGNFNLWTVGIAYRFAIPLGRAGGQ